jgi:hypothetical protein
VCSLVRLFRVRKTRKEIEMVSTAGDEDRPEQEAGRRVSDEERDGLVLAVMLSDSPSYPWSREELARTVGDRIGAFDAVARLEEAGLVHRAGEFVFPTLAARRAGELPIGR